jgi:hypothetical protein
MVMMQFLIGEIASLPHFLLVATNYFYAGLPTVFCTITQKKRKNLAILPR